MWVVRFDRRYENGTNMALALHWTICQKKEKLYWE